MGAEFGPQGAIFGEGKSIKDLPERQNRLVRNKKTTIGDQSRCSIKTDLSENLKDNKMAGENIAMQNIKQLKGIEQYNDADG